MINYVVGFVFNDRRDRVLLINKNKPEWQAGKLNGIGGKVEKGESDLEAMIREFEEETGTYIGKWVHYCELIDGNKQGRIAFFYQVGVIHEIIRNFWLSFPNAIRDGIELLEVALVKELPYSCIQNLHWLIPMALDTSDLKAVVLDNMSLKED